MSCFLFTALLIASAQMQTPSSTATKPPAAAQAAAAPTTAKVQSVGAAKSAKPAELASSDAVITIHGLCTGDQAGQNDESCTTVVTKKQFDALTEALGALGPPLLPAQRRGVAESYATTVRNYEAAKKAGVENDPRYAEVIRIAQMRAMGDMYNALLQARAKEVSPQEIRDYYNANLPKFEELVLRRVTVPRRNMANLNDEVFAAKARKIAGEMHDRAAKGDDLDAIQKEAFTALGVKDPPSTHMAVVRRGIYAPDQEKQLFDLKPGEVTGIFEQPSAFIVFKLEGRDTQSLEKSKDEIVRILVQQHQ
ncbi:MAG TPA: peptidylprolyl isomerase [Candidatus Binatia bacterium]|nr:peptidylprolyl isomerase [Candidatus Binatia bacterium]